MRPPEGSRLDDALDMFHDAPWSCPGGKPLVSTEQLAYWLAVLEPWFREEFGPKQKVSDRPNAKVDRGSQKLGRDFVYARSGGLCEIRLAEICTGRASEWHHRLNKGQGGRWDASNGLHLCAACHDFVTNRGRAEAKAKGWAVAPGITPPIDVPVLRRGVLVYLDDKGGLDPVESEVA